MVDKEILKEIGFLDAEITVYLALLRLGPSLAGRISKETGHHRTHVYDLLEKLREKGLVSTFIQSGKKIFKPYTPDKLLHYLEEKKDTIRTILPELERLTKLPKEETQVELFKGKEGLKTVFQDVLKMKSDYFVMGALGRFENIFKYTLPQFLKKVEKLGIKERVLCDEKEKVTRIKTGKYRYLQSDYLFPSSFWVYKNKVAIFIWRLPYFAIVITSEEVANTYRNYFDFFWKLAKPF